MKIKLAIVIVLVFLAVAFGVNCLVQVGRSQFQKNAEEFALVGDRLNIVLVKEEGKQWWYTSILEAIIDRLEELEIQMLNLVAEKEDEEVVREDSDDGS